MDEYYEILEKQYSERAIAEACGKRTINFEQLEKIDDRRISSSNTLYENENYYEPSETGIRTFNMVVIFCSVMLILWTLWTLLSLRF